MTGRFFFFLSMLAVLILVNGRVLAQALNEPAEVTARPVCFDIRNTAPYSVLGTVVTNIYTDPATGVQARHHENFRLESRHFVRFCSRGPFFPGRKLDLQLRALVPVFECRMRTDGPVVIHGTQNADGTYKTWADCR